MSDNELLKFKIPIDSLSRKSLVELLGATRFHDVPTGKTIFKQGDADDHAIFLLQGRVQLINEGSKDKREISADDDNARYALAQLKPRQYTGKTVTDCRFAVVNQKEMERLLTVDQLSEEWVQVDGVEINEMDAGEDTEWMMEVLRSRIFDQVPTENIAELFTRFERCDIEAGTVVIKQGEPGDYYYLIKSGEFHVSRKTPDGKVGILAKLGSGEMFGEEALLTRQPRNATVSAHTEGVVQRLSQSDFNELLSKPLLKEVDHPAAEKMLKEGAGLLDVRTETEFQKGALRVAENIPLVRLRRKLSDLTPGRKYILCCSTGARSAVGAFLLNQRGFDVYILKGGLQALTKSPSH